MPSVEMVTALTGGGVGLATAAGTVVVALSSRRTRRQERRDDFSAITSNLQQRLTQVETLLTAEQQARAEDRKQCAEERREDRRVINSLARILRTVYRHNDALAVPEPVLDPVDTQVLEQYHIR